MKKIYLVALCFLAMLASRGIAQNLAPSTLDQLSVFITNLGSNGVRVSPTSQVGFVLGNSGGAEWVYRSSTFILADSGSGSFTTLYGAFSYTASGNVGVINHSMSGLYNGFQPPSSPSWVTTLTFTSSTAGTWSSVWGNSTSFGSFVLAPTGRLVPLVNIATRVDLAAGQSAIPGFVVGGPLPRRVLVRAIGPGLGQFGVSATIPTTKLSVFSGSTVIASNSGWSTIASEAATLQTTFTSVGAFSLPVGSRDSAVLLTLAPGNYTVSAGAAGANESGTILIEVYFVP